MHRPRTLFFDCVSLSNFAMADSLELLTKRYPRRAGVTIQVADEIGEGIRNGHAKLEAVATLLDSGTFGLVMPTPAERRRYGVFLRVLSEGEASTIAVAAERGGVVVTDDRAARAVCRDQRIPFTGTLGILQACVRDEMIDSIKADAILAKMIAAGFYSPVKRLSELRF